jgi:hypothetical protein
MKICLIHGIFCRVPILAVHNATAGLIRRANHARQKHKATDPFGSIALESRF